MGAWFEAQVTKGTFKATPTTNEDSPSCSKEAERTFYYHVKFDE